MPGKSEIIVEWLNSKYKGKRSRVNVKHIVVDRKHWRRNDLYFGGGGLIQYHVQFMCSIIT